MGYIGMGAVTASDFVNRSGVCKPTNSATLATFKGMQTQLNRVATAVGVSKITVDGDLGSKTLYLLSNIASKMRDIIPQEIALANEATNDCSQVALRAETISFLAKSVADMRGVPSSTGGSTSTPRPSSPPIVPPITGGAPAAPQIGGGLWDAFKNLSTVEKAAVGVGLLAAGVAAGFIPFGKKKRGSRRTA